MKNWLSKLFFIAVGAVVIGGFVYSFWPKPVEVDLAAITHETLRVTVDEDGKTRIREKYVVSTPLSGRLLRIDMEPGDSVVADETILATVEPRDPELLDARSVALAEARVSAAESAVKRSDPMIEEARAAQELAEAQLTRIRKARQGGGMTASDLDVAESRYRQATEQVRAAKYAGEIAEFELEQARAALLRSRPREESEAELAEGMSGWNYSIRSPITGRVLRVFQESSAVMTAGATVLELGDPKDLEVEIDVLSSDAVRVNPGAKVFLEHWGGDRPLEARVRLVEPSGFTKISTLGVEEQRVNVIADLVDPPEKREALGDGFRVEARIVTAEVENALVAPNSALFRVGGDQWAVFRVADARRDQAGNIVSGTAEERLVKVGRRNNLMTEIREGLEQEDVVIVNPSDDIQPGASIVRR